MPFSRKFPIPSIREHPLPGPVSVPPFWTGHFLSRLSPEKETGIPEFEILGKFLKFSTGREISCWVLKYVVVTVLAIWEVTSSLFSSCLEKKSSGTQTSNLTTFNYLNNVQISDPYRSFLTFEKFEI